MCDGVAKYTILNCKVVKFLPLDERGRFWSLLCPSLRANPCPARTAFRSAEGCCWLPTQPAVPSLQPLPRAGGGCTRGRTQHPLGGPGPYLAGLSRGGGAAPSRWCCSCHQLCPRPPCLRSWKQGHCCRRGVGGWQDVAPAARCSCRETLRPERPNAVSGTGSCDGASQLPGAESCRPRCFPAWVFALLTLSLEPSPPLRAPGIPFLLSSSPLSTRSIAFLGKGGLLLN